MPQYAYAVIIVDGKRKVIKTKGFSDARVILAKKELERDLKAAKVEYTYIGISEHPPTTGDLEKTARAIKTNTAAAKSMDDVKGMYSFKAARGNHTRGPFEMTLKQAIEYASEWSEDSDWDYEYGVDFMSINVYRDGRPVGYVDDNNGDWHRGRTVREI